TISKFYIRLSGNPSNGRSYAFTVRINGADTTVTCSVADAATSCSDLTHSVAVSAGDLIAIHAVGTANPTARTMVWSAVFSQQESGAQPGEARAQRLAAAALEDLAVRDRDPVEVPGEDAVDRRPHRAGVLHHAPAEDARGSEAAVGSVRAHQPAS